MGYQLDFFTPGIIPESAISRKQIRHIPNFRRTALERPQRWQRCCRRAVNFGFCFDFSTNDLGAILVRAPYPCWGTRAPPLSSLRNGIPSSRSSANAWSSRLAVVTTVMSMPWILSTMS